MEVNRGSRLFRVRRAVAGTATHFRRGMSSSSFKIFSGHGKSLIRSTNDVAEISTRRLARLQQDSFAARPMVKFRSTGTLFANVTAKLASIDPLLAGRTIAM